MKNNIFDIINSVVVTNYPNNSLFAIVSNNVATVINDYANGNNLYKFDVINGTIKASEFDCDIAHVDNVKFQHAIHAYWYKLELYNIVSNVLAYMTDINEQSIRAHCINNNFDAGMIDSMLTRYNLLKARIEFVRTTCIAFDTQYNVGKTIETIVSVYHDNTIEGYEKEIRDIDTELNSINAQIDKDNNSINVKNLKTVISNFTKSVWIANDNDGIEQYVYNANTRLCTYIIGNCRKLSKSTNTWTTVSTNRLVCTVIVAMIARLLEMKKDSNNNNSENK